MLQYEASNTEEELLKSLYLMLLYISGIDDHNRGLAEHNPKIPNNRKRPNTKSWHSKENFVSLECWIGLDFHILDRLEEAGFLEQPQKGSRKQRTYIQLNKKGMKRAREILSEINLNGVHEALTTRSYHEEYINHKNRIDLMSEEQDIEYDNCDNDSEEN